ncbi:FAS1-like dehydratase domain-containing protein [Pseudonocardia humida]|uniref:MaoC family dehydratase N-terminal domain-containing protein n=1 Tax=Pseudonocardia humida TaxID=2800819 RepID=A0ABT0ZSA1_9PSEU|nr:MaoC family dehydratase N-terminal domain-containing protein [Pseudonocardia humida]MCO1653607.1 MaoC family dehydratase N-terminal domain-containing protein [Pseudonocardia humida]
MTTSPLAAAVEGWAPAPTTTTDVLAPRPAAAFSALLDLPAPAAGPGDPLPPLWHWLHFLDHPRRSELGEDGHPADGHFLPPLPHRRRMFAGGRLRVRAPMRVGDRVECGSELVSVRAKSGRSGEMLFVTLRRTFSREGRVLAVEEQDIVYRSQVAGSARPTAPAEPVPPGPPARWRIELPTDPVLLFGFSALTHNSHRIHYDAPYARGVEGYPGLVVHGPLLALLALELPRRELPGAALAEVDYRLVRPAFAGAPLVATGDVDGERLTLVAGSAGVAESVTVTARTASG